MRRHDGVAIGLSSLRSKQSCGIGEFLDLVPIIDWCKSVGFDVIQLLPLNDMGNDKSPYNAISSCALDPIYLSLAALGENDLSVFLPFNELDRVDFEGVKRLKIEWLTRYYHLRFAEVVGTKEYRDFLQFHPWVRPYALFKAYKDEYRQRNWNEWPEEAKRPSLEAMEQKRPVVDFYSFLQYLCYQQMKAVREHAEKQGLLLKGDVPILLSPDSADVWAEPHLFDQSLVAGAPPDRYNPLGQKWGFPLFDWKAMQEDGYAWWKRRLSVMGECFHIYRIDHIVGFFRIWGIPKEKKAAAGYFIPKDEELWPEHGRLILNMMIDASPLLPMAEDLGTIPPFVPIILKEMGICGTKVLRWQRTWGDGATFFPFDHYEPLSMTTVSTHDMDTLSGWWKNFPEEARVFARFKGWTYQPTLTQEQRFEILRDAYHTSSLFHINIFQETLALFPELVHANPDDERLNIPGTISETNWTYRYLPSIEEIVSHQPLAEKIRQILS